MSSLCLMLIKSSWLNSGSELAFLTCNTPSDTHLSLNRTKNSLNNVKPLLFQVQTHYYI